MINKSNDEIEDLEVLSSCVYLSVELAKIPASNSQKIPDLNPD